MLVPRCGRCGRGMGSRFKKGALVRLKAKDHFSFDSDVKISDILEDREARGLFGFEAIGWVEAEDDDYLYLRFIRPLPKGFSPHIPADGGLAVLKAVIDEVEVIKEGGK